MIMKKVALSIFALANLTLAMASTTPMDSLINSFKTKTSKTTKEADALMPTPQLQPTSSEAASDTTEAEPKAETFPTLSPLFPDENINAAIKTLAFDQATALVRRQQGTGRRKRDAASWLEEAITFCQKRESGLRGVDRVVIVDSTVVDKKEFLKAYPLSPDNGTLTLSERGDIVQYQTQLNGIVLKPECEAETSIASDSSQVTTTSSPLHLMRYYLEDDQLTDGEAVEGLGIDGDINYPFLMPDGQTFYFAARSDDGYGNYDIYATRYDGEAKRFYQAENMGYPYNSYANDYMMVIDETANLGWFASDRYQPDGKVCIYTFIPNSSRQTIDYETTDLAELRAAASLQSITAIQLTDEQQQAKANALRRIRQLSATAAAISYKEFEFVVNDGKTCHTLDDFATTEARNLCGRWLQKTRNIEALKEQLQHMRDKSPANFKVQILNLEQRIMQLQDEVNQLAKQTRKAELSQQ